MSILRPPTAGQLKKIIKSRTFAAVAAVFLVLALVGGWQIYEYTVGKGIIKTDTEPAARLVRDDTAKPKPPRLFVHLNYSTGDFLRDGKEYGSVVLNLDMDQAKCLDYYGSDGIIQCKLNWDFLNPAQADWGIKPSIPGGKWNFTHKNERYTATYTYEKNAAKSGQAYTLTIPKRLGDNVEIAPAKAQFTTSDFMPGIASWEFLADPQNPERCLVSGEIQFEWPVDKKSLEANVTLTALRADADEQAKTAGEKASSSIPAASSATSLVMDKPVFTYSEDGKTASITATILKLPKQRELVRLSVAPGIKRLENDAVSPRAVTSAAAVPGQNTYVSLSEATTLVATDANMINRQVLTLEFTRPVKVSEVHASTKAVRLPRYIDKAAQEQKTPTSWNHYDAASRYVQDALAASKNLPLPLTPIASTDEYSTVVSFSYKEPDLPRQPDLPASVFFFLDNQGGASSTADYALAPFSRIMKVAPLEKELRIMQKGTILSLNASKTLAILSRGLTHVTLDAWQVQPEYVNLLARHAPTLSRPDLFGGVEFPDISKKLTLSYLPQKTDGSEPDYHAFNLSPLLADGGKGLFRISLKGSGPDEEGNPGEYQNYEMAFLLVTDLAMNIKQSSNGERHVFISSFATGAPCAGATVEILGRNGLPVFSNKTDSSGFVLVPDVDGFTQEKEAVAIVARLGNDYTFMRMSDYMQQVSYNYDFINPGAQWPTKKGLSAFAFAERGMFRPGEELRFGAIIKNASWDNSSIQGLPIRIRLINPLGVAVYDKQHPQDSTGLVSVTIPTLVTDPTGQYTVNVLVDKQWLASTQVQVEEFQPDTLNVETGFNKLPPSGKTKGWVLPDDLRLTAQVNNLYGTPAVENKVNFSFTLTPVRLSFKEFEDYRFFDPGKETRNYSSEQQTAVTDDKGQAEFEINLKSYASGSYRLNTVAEAFEAGGGRSVTAYNSLLVSPHKVLVGWNGR